MRKLAYIFSFGHSGSTLLSLLLEQHPQTVSIGEFRNMSAKMRKNAKNKECSCRKSIQECPLWGDFYKACLDQPSMDLQAEYNQLLNSVAKSFSDDTVIVDSSKVIKNLQPLKALNDVDLRVIYLIKDYRSFLVSTKRKAIKRGEKFGLYRQLKHAWIWHRDNQYNLNYLEQLGINHLKIGYEELCLYTEDANEILCDFLGIEKNKSVNINNSSGHMILGNRMRKDSNKNTTVKYDNVWFTDIFVNIVGLLLPQVAKFNNKVTYSNKFDQIWK